MKKSNVIAVDLAKNTLQVCLMDGDDEIISNKSIRVNAFSRFLAKQEASIVAFEACSSSHYWARIAQELGHTAKILPAKMVERFRQGHKTDANDALAIGITVRQPSIHTVGIKNIEQQNVQSVIRIQQHLCDQSTATSNMIRGLLIEFGIRFPKGIKELKEKIPLALEDASNELSFAMRTALNQAWQQWLHTREALDQVEREMIQLLKSIEACKRLTALEGIGPKNALALYAELGDGKHFSNGRGASACIGLTPTQHSTGGKTKLGSIRKGYNANTRLRSTLVTGCISMLNALEKRPARNKKEQWLQELSARRGKGRTAVALANKNIRTAWSMLAHNTVYQTPELLAH